MLPNRSHTSGIKPSPNPRNLPEIEIRLAKRDESAEDHRLTSVLTRSGYPRQALFPARTSRPRCASTDTDCTCVPCSIFSQCIEVPFLRATFLTKFAERLIARRLLLSIVSAKPDSSESTLSAAEARTA